MDTLAPKITGVMKGYKSKQFFNDLKSGIIVAVIALPLSIAFALGCGASAEKGIYSAIISSIIIALLGGSRVQINGPTGAFIVITQSIVTSFGFEGLALAMIMAGIMLIIMGVCKMGKLIKYIPSPITIGFTAGIGVTIFTLSVRDFLGLTFQSTPTSFIGKWQAYILNFKDINVNAVIVGLVCIVILVVWPKICKSIPNSLVAIVAGTIIAKAFNLDVKLLGDIPKTLSIPSLHVVSIDEIFAIIQPAFTIAILVALQALLSAAVTDSQINSKTHSNAELCAQGVANIVLGFLGCIPATGGVARSIANAKNGARTPIAAIVHGITLFVFLIFLMPLIKLVPLCVLSAILMVVSYNMLNLKAFIAYGKATKSDFIVLVTACVLTFAFDLVFAIEVGMVLACTLFMRRMADVTDIQNWKYIEDEEIDEEHDPDSLNLKQVHEHVLVFEISGPLFFGATDKFMSVTDSIKPDTKVIVLRMRSVPAIDGTALTSLRDLKKNLNRKGITLLFSHVNEQPMTLFTKSGFLDDVKEENCLANIDAALDKTAEICDTLEAKEATKISK